MSCADSIYWTIGYLNCVYFNADFEHLCPIMHKDYAEVGFSNNVGCNKV